MSFLRLPAGRQESRNPEPLDISGLPLEFTPYLIRGGSDKLVIIRGPLKNHFLAYVAKTLFDLAIPIVKDFYLTISLD
jgi:hypothetical protein